MKYYAILDETEECIAEGESYDECSKKAFATGVWDDKPGTWAPYFITTIAPKKK